MSKVNMLDAMDVGSAALVSEIRHKLGNALPQIQSGFRILASGNAKDPEEAKRVHQQGVAQLLALLSHLDDIKDALDQASRGGSP